MNDVKPKRCQPHGDESSEVVYVASITLRNGRKLYARDYGLKGFPIRKRK